MNRVPQAATAGIVLSRETLYKYRSLPAGTGDEAEWLLKQINEEIEVLTAIARDAPKNAELIRLLIEAWQEFAGRQKKRAHLELVGFIARSEGVDHFPKP